MQSCNREDITGPGVYFLFCRDDEGVDSVYIGESESVKDRLMQHIGDYQAGKERYYWTTAVIFTGRDLDKTLVRYLENKLVEIARKCRRYKVLTKNTYANTVIKESDHAVMEEFLDDIRIVINALGYKVLDSLRQTNAGDSGESDDLLYLAVGDWRATGKTTTEGFVLLSGAHINERMAVRVRDSGIGRLREKCVEDGRIKDMTTTQDILFNSSSSAAGFVLGYAASGPQQWKDANGKTLKEIEAERGE